MTDAEIPGRPGRDADLVTLWTFMVNLLGTDERDRWPDMFSVGGVMEMPLVPPGFPIPRRIEGRAEIRRIMTPVQARAFSGRTVINEIVAAHVSSPEHIIVEFLAHMTENATGSTHTVPYVHIVRFIDGEAVELRDYAPFHLMPKRPDGAVVSEAPR